MARDAFVVTFTGDVDAIERLDTARALVTLLVDSPCGGRMARVEVPMAMAQYFPLGGSVELTLSSKGDRHGT
jgi:hypothetical protein